MPGDWCPRCGGELSSRTGDHNLRQCRLVLEGRKVRHLDSLASARLAVESAEWHLAKVAEAEVALDTIEQGDALHG